MARRKYLSTFKTGKVKARAPIAQTVPLSPDQVANNAGGFVFQVDCFARLSRFLVLGSEGNTYYQTEKKLTLANGQNILECLKADGEFGHRTIDTILDFWNNNRAPKAEPVMFALALVSTHGDLGNKIALKNKFNETVRTGTHLFRFVHYANEFRGWGRYLKRLVTNWYLDKKPEQVAFQAAKYQQREGWSHKDILRLVHAKSRKHAKVFKTIVKGEPLVEPFISMDSINKTQDIKRAIKAIKEHGLTHEMLPTELKGSAQVWLALFEKMPLTALIRNLGSMTSKGVFGPGKFKENAEAVKRITDEEGLRKARIHPIQILSALITYKNGHGFRGDLSWSPVPQIVDALDEAFVKAFKFVTPTNRKFLLGIDVSSSMTCGEIAGVPGLTPRQAAAAMAMVAMRTEPYVLPMAFCDRFVPLNITPKQSIDSVIEKMNRMPFGGTDCSLPMVYALKNNINVDAFVVYTDNETWAGGQHAVQALNEYRRKINKDAKLIVVAFTSTEFSIADPKDPGMLDVVGFDASAPAVMNEFVLGNI